MKKQTSISIGLIVAGCWLASGTAWAAQPIEPPQSGPQTGGIPQCQADLADAQAFPATGQQSCWDTFGNLLESCDGTGHDGDIRAGAELSYTETTYTVIDNNTKLEWMKQDDNNGGDCASYPGYLDKDCRFSWDEAFAFVAELNTEPCFADHCDWRLPNAKELLSILNYEKVGLLVSAEFNNECVAGCTVESCSCTDTSFYYSSTSNAENSEGAWGVGFDSGFVGANVFPKAFAFNRVRAVRGGL